MKLYLVMYRDFSTMGEPDTLDEIFFIREHASDYLAKNYSSKQIVKEWAWIDNRDTMDDPKISDHFRIVWREEIETTNNDNTILKMENKSLRKKVEEAPKKCSVCEGFVAQGCLCR